MADFIVRKAVKKEFPEIRRLIHEVHINPTGLDWRHFLVAKTPENILLGCGQVKTHFDGSLELASIAVNPYARGQGVARAIIQELLAQEARRPLYLMCRAQLETLYTKFGFHSIGLSDMPPYFQRIWRLVSILRSRAPTDDRLIVMKLGQERDDQ